jgi:hypothetical protein
MFIAVTIANDLYGEERSTVYVNADKIYKFRSCSPDISNNPRVLIFFSAKEDTDFLVVYETVEELLLKIKLARN